eukprot:7737139-Pyramimonas_sp.AAC.1
MERKHRVLKRLAEPRCNPQSFERGLLEECTVQHLSDIRNPLTGVGLIQPRPASKKLVEAILSVVVLPLGAEILTARAASVHSRVVQMNDVVCFTCASELRFGIVYFHCLLQREPVSCVSEWSTVKLDKHLAKCRVQDSPRLIQTSWIHESCIFQPAVTGAISQIILPPRLRRAKPS